MSERADGSFPATHWTLIARLRNPDETVARIALDELCAQYHYPLYCYIRHRGLAHHDAQDALQDFFAKLLRLGVFAGDFSLESAQDLATDAEIDEWAVLDHLGALVDKSLVITCAAGARYRMLETTRAFALERLAARGATLPMLRRHAEVVLALVERYYRNILSGGAPKYEQVKRLGADLDNLRAAIQWASGPDGDLRTAIALVGAAGAGRSFLTSAGLGSTTTAPISVASTRRWNTLKKKSWTKYLVSCSTNVRYQKASYHGLSKP